MNTYERFLEGFVLVILGFILLPLFKVFTIIKPTEYSIVVFIGAIIVGILFEMTKEN